MSESILMIDEYGNKFWKLSNGNLHRVGGPAYENRFGDQEWYINGKRHREDGPAVIWANGNKMWWFDGEFIRVSNQEEFERGLPLLQIKQVTED